MRTGTKITLLLMLFALYYLLPVPFRDLWQPDELRYAEISREMIVSGNWVVPHFFDLRYFEKPVAGYWINNLGQLLFGHTNFGVRAGALFSTLCSGLLIFWLGCRMFASRNVALLASTVFLTSLLVYGIGTYAVLDPVLLLWLTGAMCSFWYAVQARTFRQRFSGYLLLGAACAMGFMTKGFLALAVPVLAIVPWMVWQRRFTELLRWGPLALLTAVLLSLPWALAIAQQAGDFWHYFFWVEHIQRFAEENAQHKAPFWYYLPVLVAGTLPWLGLLPGALISGWQQRRQQAGVLYLLSWVLLPLLFFSIAKGKLPTYILPCFAPLSLLIAGYASGNSARLSTALRFNGWINLLFGALTALAVISVLAPWGLAHRPLYSSDEKLRATLAALAFTGWALAAGVSLRTGRWQLAALCPLALALLVGFAIPDRIRDAKQPQNFVRHIQERLAQSRFILADNPGVGSAIAWQLKRSDILFYSSKGELEYGLSYADARKRYVAGAEFADWLRVSRREGDVALVLMLDAGQKTPDAMLPVPDDVWQQGRLVYYSYRRAP
ncbi:lipid IV(A) 4-amino-4-deoxy-L-arabinosyltransferase [Pantoea eucrina]|jgi:4-amino-4-deoxy-L-arabinose transferase|uniref:Undecaprenyl phosphate-alpha-4-amino-4-deoxy-L-arabinose arabinosyl transferase n=1 Tax=Pantoea eucrina TaxID=472693 RepID=A0ABS1Z538_9GAMM|nr:lipid IV(A) 4-amino-4-deoxy-L-arabinosyltransferase [Pantoea eucrina]AJA71017.1 4-amino-4-deoxy-L-arabinose transferase [Pantoea sp. PSNIH1]MBM0747517.1 lipid IV(A) 4-amino-4-deoxy-L-arabinosyltransferase [Pantoea eucrina]QNH52940.1 lipid IV(A) 4-amino-4-deoxy-L-arabinosyltransferase [Acinetobacter venetianus]UBB15189.1 lipid IV(A) 4-amino-4-deoxy-L-arabinosyltransferase [Pantoea eucrina]